MCIYIYFISFKVPSKKNSGPENFSGEFGQSFMGKIKLTLHKYFQEKKKKETYSIHFMKNYPNTKLDRHYKTRKLQNNLS